VLVPAASETLARIVHHQALDEVLNSLRRGAGEESLAGLTDPVKAFAAAAIAAELRRPVLMLTESGDRAEALLEPLQFFAAALGAGSGVSVLPALDILPGRGFTPANGYQLLSLGNGPDLRAACGSVLYLALIALLSLGIATAVRDSAVAIGTVLALLYLFPIVAAVVSNQHWQRHLEQIGPMTAGLYIQATVGVHALPLTPWQGLGVLALWAAGALILGGLVLRFRDA